MPAPRSTSSIIGTTEIGEKGEGWPGPLKSLKTKLWEKKGTAGLLEPPGETSFCGSGESDPSGGSNLQWRLDRTLEKIIKTNHRVFN